MDYGVTLILEHFDKSLLTAPIPIDTAWGVAVRAGEEGTYTWKIVVVSLPVPAKHVLGYIPPAWQGIIWQSVTIQNFQWGADRITERVHEDLLEFIAMVLARSERWCVAIEKDCDQMESVCQISKDQLIEAIRSLFEKELP